MKRTEKFDLIDSFFPAQLEQLCQWELKKETNLRRKTAKRFKIFGKIRDDWTGKLLMGLEIFFDIGKKSRFEMRIVFCFEQVLNNQET